MAIEGEPEEEPVRKKRKADLQALQVNQHDRLSHEIGTVSSESADTLAKIQEARGTITEEDETVYKMYVDMLKSREEAILKWTGAALGAPEEAREAAIKNFNDYHEDACKPEKVASLPSPDFGHLKSLHEIIKIARSQTDSAQSVDELKQAMKSFTEQKSLAKNLISCGGRAVKDLLAARKARTKSFEQQVKKEAAAAKAAAKAKAKEDAKAAGHGAKPPKGAQSEAIVPVEPLPPILSFATSTQLADAVAAMGAMKMTEIEAGDFASQASAIDGAVPYVVRSAVSLSETIRKDEIISSKLAFCLRSFSNSPQKAGSGRGTMHLPDLQSLRGSLLQFAVASTLDRSSIADQQLQALLHSVGAYAFAESMRYTGTEFKQAATLRLQLKGRRRLYARLQDALLKLIPAQTDENSGEASGAVAKMAELSITTAAQLGPETIIAKCCKLLTRTTPGSCCPHSF